MSWSFVRDTQQKNPKSFVVFPSLSLGSFGSVSTFHDANADSFEDYMGEACSTWDNEMAEDGKTNFCECAKELMDKNLDRKYFTNKLESAELHFFLMLYRKQCVWFLRFELNVGDLVRVVGKSIENILSNGTSFGVHRGSDCIVRSARVTAATGVIQRPLAQLATVFY